MVAVAVVDDDDNDEEDDDDRVADFAADAGVAAGAGGGGCDRTDHGGDDARPDGGAGRVALACVGGPNDVDGVGMASVGGGHPEPVGAVRAAKPGAATVATAVVAAAAAAAATGVDGDDDDAPRCCAGAGADSCRCTRGTICVSASRRARFGPKRASLGDEPTMNGIDTVVRGKVRVGVDTVVVAVALAAVVGGAAVDIVGVTTDAAVCVGGGGLDDNDGSGGASLPPLPLRVRWATSDAPLSRRRW